MSNKRSEYFPKPLRAEYLGNNNWKLFNEFQYISPKYGNVIVPIGFVTDGASVPDFLYSIMGSPWQGGWEMPAVIHDYNYFLQSFSRNACDEMFLEGMKICKVPFWKRQLAFAGVRLFGWLFWK